MHYACKIWCIIFVRYGYWVNYNIVEAGAWIAKAAVILPGLIWQKEIWQLHLVTLLTSGLLIWVSERKLLPTMVIVVVAAIQGSRRGVDKRTDAHCGAARV